MGNRTLCSNSDLATLTLELLVGLAQSARELTVAAPPMAVAEGRIDVVKNKTNGLVVYSNAPSGFTIHGLWTDYNDGTWPSCCRGPRFDMKEIAPLLKALQKYWPSLSCSGSSTCHGGKGPFWAHEEILIEAGYPPSNEEKYPLGGIISAVEIAVGATPLIVCSHGAVEELRICFYKDFQPRDCVADASSHGNTFASSSCPRYVSLPEYTREWPWKRGDKNMITQSQAM
ncbi:hypothetical protein Scep_029247 [Stephania cephalantha]|uniref:Uncharacterized protein n=1 Tax=Stephania cephalantha TaxID=152367 RepID=A0AAP0DXG7_9MAGN